MASRFGAEREPARGKMAVIQLKGGRCSPGVVYSIIPCVCQKSRGFGFLYFSRMHCEKEKQIVFKESFQKENGMA